jgi:3-oxosteroid 1-dehydrogenase
VAQTDKEPRRLLVENDNGPFDVVIVGSGGGALTAALKAHEAGLRVKIFEKADRIGGGTAYSGGVVWAPCNHVMRRKNIQDSVDDAVTYASAAAAGRGDEAIQRAYIESVAGIIEEVEQWTGLKWIIWVQPDYYPDLPGARQNGRAILPHPTAADDLLIPAEDRLPALKLVRPTPHMDFVPGFQTVDRRPRDSWLAGRSIIGGLWKAVLEREIPYEISARAQRLIWEDERVAGVEIEHADGQTERIMAGRGVLLNTGGFDWNEQFSRRYLPGPQTLPHTPPSNTGDGHIMAMLLGAATALMDKAIWIPAIRIPGDTHDEGQPLYRMFNLELARLYSIVVNRTGRRFASEAAYFEVTDAWAHMNPHSREYDNMPSYFICDEQYRQTYGFPGAGPQDPVPDWITQRPTLWDLAGALEIDPAGLTDEVDIFNEDAETGTDRRFHRGETAYEQYWGEPDHKPNSTMAAVREAPFYGFQLYLTHSGARGGVVTTPDAEVVRADGSVIPGLYACGNTAANLLFGASYASGSAIGSSMVFGYRAMQHAAS